MTGSHPHPTRTEMKTAIELADELSRPVRVNGLCLEAAAMLRQQAEQIEQLGRWESTHAPRIEALEGLLATTQRQVSTSREAAQMLESERQANAILTTENEALLKANRDCMDHFTTLKTDYDALKADAERFVTLSECVISSDLPHDLGVAETVDEVRAAIDAMKGQE